MEDNRESEDPDKEQRRLSALKFCIRMLQFVAVSSICVPFFVLLYYHWDWAILKGRYMLIFYCIEVILFAGAINVAVTGWQEK